jgi:hypothetical protein
MTVGTGSSLVCIISSTASLIMSLEEGSKHSERILLEHAYMMQ